MKLHLECLQCSVAGVIALKNTKFIDNITVKSLVEYYMSWPAFCDAVVSRVCQHSSTAPVVVGVTSKPIICMHMYSPTCTCTCIHCTCVYICMYMYVLGSLVFGTLQHASMYMYTCTYMYMYMYIYMYIARRLIYCTWYMLHNRVDTCSPDVRCV